MDPRECADRLPPRRHVCLGKVVDDELRVKGLEGIRVVDGSVVPNLMRGHPHPQISMVALRAAELIRRAPTPAPSSA